MAAQQRLDDGTMASAPLISKQKHAPFLPVRYGIPRDDAALYRHAGRTL